MLDFLFDYYPYSPGRLGTWHPGLGVRLRRLGAVIECSRLHPRRNNVGSRSPHRRPCTARASPEHSDRNERRDAQHSCFGMHEWAMVYGTSPLDVRHESESLRVSPTEIASVVDSVGLRCTHIDAFRFFTSEAEPLNEHTPTRARQANDEQPGCIHANMDLYKYAMWFQPYIPGNLVVDCFELAVYAREIDMRASPYDLTHLGYSPIAVETIDGRREYASAQRDIAAKADFLRQRLITGLTAVDTPASASPDSPQQTAMRHQSRQRVRARQP